MVRKSHQATKPENLKPKISATALRRPRPARTPRVLELKRLRFSPFQDGGDVLSQPLSLPERVLQRWADKNRL